MADDRRRSRPKTRRRSKSAAASERSSFNGETHRYELMHSVSYTEKAEAVKKKSKKQLQDEHIALDSAKLMVERKLNDLDKKCKMLEQNKENLKDLLQKREHEIKILEEEGSALKQEIGRVKDDLSRIKADFEAKRAETSFLKETLKKSNQEKCRLKTEHDAERRDLMEKQASERKENWEFVRHFSKLLEDNRANVYVTGSSKNVQIGGSNVVKEESNSGKEELNIVKEEIKSQWKELTDKLCLALEDHMIKRRELEMKAHNDEVLLKEMKESVNKILKNLDNTTSKRLGKDKELLEFLTSDRSDERVLTDGVKQLKRHFSSSKARKNLPLAAEVAVTRLLNKFDRLSCKEFVEVLEGKTVQSDISDADETKRKEVEAKCIQLDESEKVKPINRHSCIEILSKWLTQSEENDEEQLLGRIKVYESKLSTEMVLKYQEEIQNKKTPGELHKMQLLKEHTFEDVEIPYASLPRTQTFQGLPDALSQFMHQLEGLKIVLEIDKKVDKICGALKLQGNENSTETSL